MKLVAICGSPKKGNCYWALNLIKENHPDIDFKLIMLNEVNLEPCKGCYLCIAQGEELCPLKDDRDMIIEEISAADGTILGGILGRDWSAALAAGISGFDGVLQELGKSMWAVSLDGDLLIVPRNQITPGRTWVTLESLLLALEGLKEKIPVGEQFDNISAMVAEIKLGHIGLIQLLIAKQLDIGTES